MVYRDDMTALQARCEALEEELEGTRSELSRLDEVEWEKAHLEDRVNELEQRLFELRSQLDPRAGGMVAMNAARRAAALFAAASIALLGGLMMHIVGVAHRHQMAAYQYHAMADQARVAEAHTAWTGAQYVQQSWPVSPSDARGVAYQAVSRSGRIIVATGEAPAAAGTACRVYATPTFDYDGFNCRLEVTCGNEVIYGGPSRGYMMCGYQQGFPSFGEDDGVTQTDGDPRLQLDMPHNRVVVSDGFGPGYSISIALDHP